jgi:hypothetical protein
MTPLPQLEPEPTVKLDPDKVAILERFYASLPKMNCQGKCQGCCGPLVIPDFEAKRIAAVQGKPLTATRGGKLDLPTCDALDDRGRCSVYDVRPAICRIWGVARTMQCPWGCKPDRYLYRRELDVLLKTLLAQLGGELYCSWPQMQVHLNRLAHQDRIPDNAQVKLLG